MRAQNFFATAPLSDLRILRKPAVIDLVGLSGEQIRNLENAGDFPPRVVLGENSVGWVEIEVREWLAARAMRASTKPLGARRPRKSPVRKSAGRKTV